MFSIDILNSNKIYNRSLILLKTEALHFIKTERAGNTSFISDTVNTF